MIVVTGAAGFIGSCMLGKLNGEGRRDIVIVDDFSKKEKEQNYVHAAFCRKIDREDFIDWFSNNASEVEGVFHLGARTDTTEFDWSVFERLNLEYTKSLWKICSKHSIPLVYASSAATYGAGEFGYDDNTGLIEKLKPLNPYGRSKQEFDLWALSCEEKPIFWAGLKFFNVYGPNEYHKGRMASVIYHSFNQINDSSEVRLFRSHKEGYRDGWQMRDFVYVKDVVNVMYYLMTHRPQSDIYNLGTGTARSFYDLARATFDAMGRKENIRFIDMPEDIRDKYQYFTEAKMSKLRRAGYNEDFFSLEDGVRDYVRNYLIPAKYY